MVVEQQNPNLLLRGLSADVIRVSPVATQTKMGKIDLEKRLYCLLVVKNILIGLYSKMFNPGISGYGDGQSRDCMLEMSPGIGPASPDFSLHNTETAVG